MLELLWVDVLLLTVASVVAVLDLDVHWRGVALGRQLYGFLVLSGLLLLLLWVTRHGEIPLPGYLIGLFAGAFLPFLSPAFIDLHVTDARARTELESLLLTRDFGELLHASDDTVLREGGRRLRMHWEGRNDNGTLVLELDVHPSLWPITVSRPHVAIVIDQRHLERIRDEVRRRREREGSKSGT